MQVGVGNFSGGVTLRDHVSDGEPAVMKEISGYDPASGTLKPENVVSKLNSATVLPGTTPEQAPAVFVEGSAVRLIARDKDEKLREFSSGAWGAAGAVAPIVKESSPVRLGEQIIFATDGPDPQLVAYEPASPTTKLRPLSFKSPSDYASLTKLAVTPSASEFVQLFDCEANVWSAAVDTGCTVDNTMENEAVLSFGPSATADAKCFTKSLGDTGISLVGARYLILDAMLVDDPQPYSTMGYFINDAGMYQSGYELWLYNNTTCDPGNENANVIARLLIPQLKPLSKICRVVFYLGQLSGTVKGLSINTSYNFVAPDAGKTLKLHLYSKAVDDTMSSPGNWLAPVIRWDKNDFSAQFEKQVEYTAPAVGNLVTNSDFEQLDEDEYGHPTLPHGWTLLEGASVSIGESHSGNNSIIMDNYNPGSWTRKGVETADWVDVSPGEHYNAECWFVGPISYPGGGDYEFDLTVTFDNGTTRSKHWGRASGVFGWTKLTLPVTVPSNATSCKIKIQGANGDWGMAGFRVDDVSLSLASTKPSAGTCAVIWQTFDPAGTDRDPANSMVEYTYAFGGRDTLSKPVYNVMVSNPCAEFAQVFANPWRSYKIDVTLPVNALGETVITEYGDYVKQFLLYRRIYDGKTETWGDWKFFKSLPVALSASTTDEGVLDDDQSYTEVDGYSVPEVLELTNDYASSAKFAMVSEGRVYAACLDWDNTSGKWGRKTAIEVSSLFKPWAFPTTVSDNSPSTDGGELDGYAVTGSEVRGMIARADEKFIFLDTEFFLLRGDTPKAGYRFVRLDSVGCKSGRTIADCRSALIWHGPDFFYAYAGGQATPISRFKVDSSLIDWTKPHNAVYSGDKYICYCEYNDVPSLLIFDLTTRSWRIRSSTAYNMAGIAVDGSTGAVYGVTPTGDAVNLFGSSTGDYGAASTVRDVKTQYLVVSSPSVDAHISRAVIEAETDSTGGVTLSLTFKGRGAVNETQTHALTVLPGRFRYFVPLNLSCESVAIEASYTGTTPPTIYYMGVDVDEAPAR